MQKPQRNTIFGKHNDPNDPKGRKKRYPHGGSCIVKKGEMKRPDGTKIPVAVKIVSLSSNEESELQEQLTQQSIAVARILGRTGFGGLRNEKIYFVTDLYGPNLFDCPKKEILKIPIRNRLEALLRLLEEYEKIEEKLGLVNVWDFKPEQVCVYTDSDGNSHLRSVDHASLRPTSIFQDKFQLEYPDYTVAYLPRDIFITLSRGTLQEKTVLKNNPPSLFIYQLGFVIAKWIPEILKIVKSDIPKGMNKDVFKCYKPMPADNINDKQLGDIKNMLWLLIANYRKRTISDAKTVLKTILTSYKEPENAGECKITFNR